MIEDILLGICAVSFFAATWWHSTHHHHLPYRFQCLDCKRWYHSTESDSQFNLIFCSRKCETHHRVEAQRGTR